MTRTLRSFPILFAVACIAWAIAIGTADKVLLPRHPAARDLPYANGPSGDAARKEPFNRSMTDPLNLLVPDHLFAMREKNGVSLPSWNPLVLGGFPTGANPLTCTYDPLNPARWPLDPLHAWTLNAILRVFILATTTWWFARRLGIREGGAAFAGVAAGLGGWCAARLFNAPIVATAAWIPLALAGVWDAASGRRRSGVLACASGLALAWVSGFPQLAALATVACGVATLWLFIDAPVEGTRAKTLVGVAIAGVLSVALAAPQLCAVIGFRPEAARRGMSEEARNAQRLPPGALVAVPFRNFLGGPEAKPIDELPDAESDPLHRARWSFARAVIGGDGEGRISRTAGVSERTWSPGIVALLAAAAGIFFLRDRRMRLLVVLATTGLVFAMVPIPDSIAVPLFLSVGAPARSIVLTALIVPLAAALTFELLLSGRRPRGFELAIGFALAAVATLGILAAASDAVLVDSLADAISGPRALRLLGIDAPPPRAYVVDTLTPLAAPLRADLFHVAIFGTAACLLLLAAGRPKAMRAVPLLAVAAVVFDLGPDFLAWNRPTARLDGWRATPSIDTIVERQAQSPGWMIRVSGDAAAASAEKDALFPPNMPIIHGIADSQGYREQASIRWIEALKGTAALANDIGVSGIPLSAASSPVLDALAIRWVVSARPLDGATDFAKSGLRRTTTRLDDGGDLHVYENPDARPLVEVMRDPSPLLPSDEGYFFPGWQMAGVAEGWRNGSWKADQLLLADPITPPPSATPSTPVTSDDARIAFRTPDTVVVEAALTRPGWLVLREAHAEGWKASASGDWHNEDLSIERAMGLFRAVALPAGRHTVTFRWSPWSERIGFIVAAAALCALILVGRMCAPGDPLP